MRYDGITITITTTEGDGHMVSTADSRDDRIEALEARAIETDWLVPVGRLGWVAKGVVYGLVGVLTVPIAFGSGGGEGEASRSGAIAEIADASYGTIALWLLAAGLVLYAIWRLVTAFLPGDNDLDTLAHRIGYFSSAVFYGYLAWTAISFTTGGSDDGSSGGGSGGGGLESLSKTLMEQTAGRWLLGAIGAGGVAVGGYFAYKAYDKRFMTDLDLSGASTEEREAIEKTGMAGWVGRAVTTALVSIFVLVAAVTAEPSEAKGLDAALRDISDNWWGAALVLIAGIGLIAYGLFAAGTARRRRLVGP